MAADAGVPRLREDSTHLHHEKLLSAADELLYAAKHAGRNQVSAG